MSDMKHAVVGDDDVGGGVVKRVRRTRECGIEMIIEDLMIAVLSYLPMHHRVACRSVCRYLYHVTANPHCYADHGYTLRVPYSKCILHRYPRAGVVEVLFDNDGDRFKHITGLSMLDNVKSLTLTYRHKHPQQYHRYTKYEVTINTDHKLSISVERLVITGDTRNVDFVVRSKLKLTAVKTIVIGDGVRNIKRMFDEVLADNDDEEFGSVENVTLICNRDGYGLYPTSGNFRRFINLKRLYLKDWIYHNAYPNIMSTFPVIMNTLDVLIINQLACESGVDKLRYLQSCVLLVSVLSIVCECECVFDQLYAMEFLRVDINRTKSPHQRLHSILLQPAPGGMKKCKSKRVVAITKPLDCDVYYIPEAADISKGVLDWTMQAEGIQDAFKDVSPMSVVLTP